MSKVLEGQRTGSRAHAPGLHGAASFDIRRLIEDGHVLARPPLPAQDPERLPLKQGDLNKPTYVTAPYLSSVTGRRCVTIGSLARDVEGRRYFLCLDVRGDLGADGSGAA